VRLTPDIFLYSVQLQPRCWGGSRNLTSLEFEFHARNSMLGVRPLLLLALAQCCLGQSFLGNFYNTKAVRWIDVRDDVVRVKVGLGVKQRGSTPAAAYYLAIPKEQHSTLAYINVRDETGKKDCKVELAPKAEGGK